MNEKQADMKNEIYEHNEAPSATPSHDSQTRLADSATQLAEDVANTKPSPWTPSMFRLYGCLVVAYLCGCLNGYDGSLMGGLNALPSYLRFFNMYVHVA